MGNRNRAIGGGEMTQQLGIFTWTDDSVEGGSTSYIGSFVDSEIDLSDSEAISFANMIIQAVRKQEHVTLRIDEVTPVGSED